MGENKEYVTRVDEKGSINISEDVIAVIVSAAVQDVDGVGGVPAAFGDIADFLGKKSTPRGVKIQITEDDAVSVEAFILVRFGYVIADVAREVQNSVTNAVEATTGLSVAEVNVNVCGIAFEKDK